MKKKVFSAIAAMFLLAVIGLFIGIHPVSVQADTVSYPTFVISNIPTQTFTGSAIEPKVSVSYKENASTAAVPLTESVDYNASYTQNVNAGNSATLTISGLGNYASVTNGATKTFTIQKATPTFDVTGISTPYDGTAKVVSSSNVRCTNIANFIGVPSISYNTSDHTAPVNQGSYSATLSYAVTDNTNAVNVNVPITISRKSLNNATITVSGTYSVTGKPITPTFTVSVPGVAGNLTKDKDFTASITNNTAAGTGHIIINGIGNYTGQTSEDFTISKASVSTTDLTAGSITVTGLDAKGYAYTGRPLTPNVVVKNGTSTLTRNKDYTVSYDKNIEVGTADVIITGMGNYSGSRTEHFNINARVLTSANIANIPAQTFIGYTNSIHSAYKTVEPDVKVIWGGTTLIKDVDYTVSYLYNKAVGTGKVIVQAKPGSDADHPARYTGSAEKTFTISAHQIKPDDVDLQYSTIASTGSALTPTVTVYQDSLSNITLVNGTDYSVAYTNNTNVGTATVTVKGIGPNFSGTVTKTFTITNNGGTKNISQATVSAIPAQTYSGTAKQPGVSVIFKGITLRQGTDYTVNYRNNTNVGSGSVTIVGKGEYTGSLTRTFTINPANISGVSVSGLTAQKYTGSAVKPSITLTYGGKTLIEGEDYGLSFSNNVNLGTATVSINGLGNFTGFTTKTFQITEKGSESEEKKVWATGFTLDDTYTVVNGGTVTINPILTPSDANKYTIRWSSSNANFKFVDGDQTNTAETTDSVGAVVRGASEGSTIITATLYDENSKEIGTQYTLVKTGKQFSDVLQDYYTTAVSTLANYGYTTGSGSTREWHATPVINGTSSTTFTPSGDVTRAQFVMMLYNKAVADYKAGKTSTDPSKAPASNFSDVNSYTEAINWAVANGITFGKGNNTFDPNGTVTRAEAVAFLQRYMKGGNANTTKFTDVKNDAYYAGAVGWAVANGITAGTSNTTFSPQQKCNRAQAATFIYRAVF